MARLTLKNITKRFGTVTAVNDLNMDVKDKEFIVLLGPSGCGKTTTLRCVAGLEMVDEGEIYIGDTLVNDLPPKERDVAMVFQNYALYPHMSVFDNIAFPLKMKKYPKQEIEKKVREVAKFLEIEQLLDRKPKQLSGGQQQRVALGRAIVREPKLFLMDEPLSNLDAKLRLYMRAELKRLQKYLGITTLYVTHDQAEAMTMADRIAIMNAGVLQQFDTPTQAYYNPKNMFVAGFIGSPPTNFIDVTLVEKDGKHYLDAGEFTYPISEERYRLIRESTDSDELVLGVRPEDVKISLKEMDRSMFAEVYVTEPLGMNTIVNLKLGKYLIKSLVEGDFYIELGKKVWVTFRDEKTYLFDKKTEKAIA